MTDRPADENVLPPIPVDPELLRVRAMLLIHFDNLQWSRLQTLLILHSATIASAWAARNSAFPIFVVQWSSVVLCCGAMASAFLYILLKRDQQYRQMVPIRLPDAVFQEPGPLSVLGIKTRSRALIRVVFVVIIVTDLLMSVLGQFAHDRLVRDELVACQKTSNQH